MSLTIFSPLNNLIPKIPQCACDHYLKKRSQKRIEVVSFVNFGGLGDLSCGLKISQHLAKKFPQYKVRLLVQEEYLNDCKAITGQEYSNIKIKVMPSEDNEKPKLRIYAPSTTKSLATNPSTTTWKIHEYGGKDELLTFSDVKAQKELEIGLGKNQIGIFVNPELRKFASRFSDEEPVQDIQFLEKISRSDLKELLLKDQSIENYFQKNQLFFAYIYSPWSVNKVLHAFAQKEKINSERDIDVVIPYARLSTPWGLEKIISLLDLGPLKEMGYEDFEIHAYNDNNWNLLRFPINQSIEKERFVDDNKKVIRLFLTNKIPHQDILNLMCCSDEFTFVTGEHSLSEAISIGKIFGYEKVNTNHTQITEDIKQLASGPSQKLFEHICIKSDTDEKFDFKSISELFNQPKLRSSFKALNHKLCEKNVCESVESAVSRWENGWPW